uniref:Uncharacterized protein n=1 Tax=Anguilla anguilla TaxID=7936 RepID=A0A0E9VBA0_ANGAN
MPRRPCGSLTAVPWVSLQCDCMEFYQ